MSADIIQAQYEQLAGVAKRFAKSAQAHEAMQSRVRRSMSVLRSGWSGKGSTAFFTEMDAEVLPAVQRLTSALAEARSATQRISAILRVAEGDAARPFKGDAASAAAPGSDSGGGFWGAVGDFFTGAGAELKDMVTGLWNMVTNPVGTAKGLWHGRC